MNKRKIYTLIVVVLVTVGIVASQVKAAGAECMRNCPTPMMVVTELPPSR